MKAVLNLDLGEILALIEYHDKMLEFLLNKGPGGLGQAMHVKEHQDRIEQLTRIKDEFWPK